MNYKRKKSYWQQDIKKADYGKAAFKGLALLSGIAYLFYDFFLGGLMFSPFLVIYLRIWEKQYIKKQQQEFCAQFKMSLQSMASALNVGYSAENALKETAKDLSLIYKKDTRIMREYTYMIHQLNMNVPLEQIWKEFADRVGQEDVSNFVSVFVAAKRAGGDSIEMIRNAVKQICEKIEVKREIEMTMSAKKLEFQVMSVVPFGIIFYMRIAFPDFVEVLYRNFLGIFVMTVCLAVYAGAFYMGKLKYGEEERIYMRSANLFPPKLKGDEKIVAQLAGQVAEKEKEHPEQKQVELPETLEGKPVSWRRPEENRGYVILGLGLVGSILLILLEKETQKEEMKKKKKQMMIDYPEILNKFVLFLGAGMTVKAAWQKISSDYEKGKIMGKERFAYEEMAYTLREMQAGGSEKECYEHFGKRCEAVCYMRFGALLSQNLKRGSKGLADLLRLEAVNAFEERKRAAKKAGEEVGTKLLAPMFFMLTVVLVIVIVPAFLSMQF